MDGIWIWIFIAFFLIWPQIQQKQLAYRRYSALKSCEKKRGTRIITLIHRQENTGFFGMFSRSYIDIEDSEAVLRAIRMTESETPIDIVLHTPGGLVLASEQIASALAAHPSKVTAIVPHYAMSGGTLIALAADEILMDPFAVLGPVDPQLGQYPAASILKAVEAKPIARVSDETLIFADMSRKAIDQTYQFVCQLLKKRMPEQQANELAMQLTQGTWTHDYAITADKALEMGLPVQTNLLDQVCDLMSLYSQGSSQRPSVQYIPLPYKDYHKNE